MLMRSLVARGLCGVKLATSDGHSGLKKVVSAELPVSAALDASRLLHV